MEEQPIESENVEAVETTGGDDRGKRLQAVYSMLDSDEAYRPYVPATYDEFLGKIGKDRNYAQAIHKMVASDEVYSQYLPETFDETVTYFGLGKPTATPPSASGLASTQSGGQMPMAQQPRSGVSPSSAQVYLSPEELGAQPQMPREEVIQTQTAKVEVPTPQELEPFKDPKLQLALRAELAKKKAVESKTESEAQKGSLLGAMYNSAIEGTGKMLEGGAYMLGVMFGGDSEQFGDDTEDQRIEELDKRIKEVGIKKTIDQLKSKDTTQEFIDKTKEEGGIIAKGVLGLAESAPAMVTPMQVGFLFSTFEDAHKEIRKEMPDASPAAQFLYAATQGSVAMLLEKAGFSNLIQNKSVMKNLTGKIVNEIREMGVKMTPEVLESTAAKLVNGFLAEGETGAAQYVTEQSIKQIADALEGEKDVFEFDGWQNFISNTVESFAAEGVGGFVMKSLGEAASAIKSPADKQKVEQDKQQVADMMNDLSNPNVSPEAKQAISKKVDEKAEAILETYATEQSKIEGLSEEGKREFTFLSDQATSMEAVIADPNVSDATKQAVQSDLEETNKKIEAILASAKPKVEQQEFNNLSDTDKATIQASQDIIETYKKILAIPGASESAKDDAQKNIDEANKKIESILASAKEAPTTQQPTAEIETTDNTETILDKAEKQGGPYSKLAKALRNALAGVKTMVLNNFESDASTEADYGNGEIRINNKSKFNKMQLFFHEALHHVTLDKLSEFEKNPNSKNLTPQDFESIANLKRIFKKVTEELNKKQGGFGTKKDGKGWLLNETGDQRGFANVHEFISEAFSNPEMQKMLKEMKGEGKSSNLFQEFLDEIAKMFGITDKTILDDIFYHTESLIDKGAGSKSTTETAQPKVTVEEIKSLPLTRIEGAGMGSNQAVGTFISTEPENRYAAQFPDKEVQSMEVDIENPFVSEDTNLIDFRNELANRRKAELDETDFTEVEIPDGNFTIDDLSDSGIEKVASMVTEELKAKGYDSIYFPKTETQEGELVVFDRSKARKKGEAATKTVEQLRADEQAELAQAIPNMAEYPNTYGENQGNMPDDLYAVYKPIYDKYDALITPKLEAEKGAASTQANPLADVESTAKALGDIQLTDSFTDFVRNELPSFNQDLSIVSNQDLSEAYHKAKQDDSNPKLVQAVEQLLTPQQTPTQTKTQPDIILSGAAGGFKGVSNNAFDLRSLNGIRQAISDNISFAKIFEYKGKKYVGVGLVLSMDSQRGDPNGRNNYSFAVAELNENTPSNIVETLENSARENFKNIYNDFSSNDSVSPIEEVDAELNNLTQKPTQDATQTGGVEQQLREKPFVRAEDLGDSDVIRPNERIPPMFNGMTIPTKSNEVGRDIIISIPIEMMDDKSSMIVNPAFFATDFAESLIGSGKSFDDIVFSPFKSSVDNGSASPRTELSLSSKIFSTTKNDISAQLARLSPDARKSAILLVPGKFISSEFDSATLAYAIDGHRLIFTGFGAINLPLSTPRVLPFELLRANGTTIHNFFLDQSNVPLNKGVSNSIKSEIENDSKRQVQPSNQQQRAGTAQQQQGQQEDRNNQEENVTPSQAEAGGGNRVAEGGAQQEVTPEQQGVAGTYGSEGEVKFADGIIMSHKFKLIEADDMQPSHLVSGQRNPKHLIALAQPKERNDQGSRIQQDKIADNPRLQEVGDSPIAYTGAPIVNKRGEVIQGNNRSLGLKKHYEIGGKSYKEQLAENAEKFGLTKEQVMAMKNPVLVREVAASDQAAIVLGNYDVKDIETGGKQRIDPIVTSRKIKPSDRQKLTTLVFDGDKTVKEAIRDSAREIATIIKSYINPAQMKTAFSSSGEITASGMDDIEGIMNSFLYEDGPASLPEVFSSLPNVIQKGVQKGIPSLVSVSPEKSLLKDVQNAMTAVYEYIQSGADNFDVWSRSVDMFLGVSPQELFSPLELDLANKMLTAKKQSDIANIFKQYQANVTDQPAGLFDEAVPGLSKKDAIAKQFNLEYDETNDIKAESEDRVTPTLRAEGQPVKPIAENEQDQGGAKEAKVKPQPIKEAGNEIANAVRKVKISRPDYLSSSLGTAVWDAAVETVASAIEGGAKVAQAIQNAITQIKESEYYKSLNDSMKRKFLSDFVGSVNNSITPEIAPDYSPLLSIGEIDSSSLKSRILKGKASKAIKEMVEANGINYEVQNQELARGYANAIIDEIGLEAAVDLAARNVIKGAPKTFILGANVDAKTKNGDSTAEAMEAINLFDEALRAAGREIAAAYRVYLNSPQGLYAFEKQKIKKNVDQTLSKGQKNVNIKKTKTNVDKNGKSTAKDVAKEVTDELAGKPPREKNDGRAENVNKQKQEAAQKKKAAALSKLKANRPLTSGGLSPEFIEGLVELGAANIELGYYKVEAWLRQMKKDLKSAGIDNISDEDILSVLDQKGESGKSFAEEMEIAKWESAAEQLAAKIHSLTKEPTKGYDPVKVLINGLYQKVAEKVKTEKKKPLSDLEKAKVLVKNYENAKSVWEQAKEIELDNINAMQISSEEKAALVDKLWNFFDEVIGFPFSEKTTEKLISKELQDRAKDNKNVTNVIEGILADSFVYGVDSKQGMIDNIVRKLEVEANISASDAKKIAQKFADKFEERMAKETEAFLNKQFKPKPLENQVKRQQQHKAIVREIIWGALDNQKFKQAFYDKYGFDYMNDPKFDQALKDLTAEVYKAPEGFLRDEAMSNLAAFVRIAEHGYNYWAIPNSLIVDNLLFGTETFIKATDSNTVNSIAMLGQMIAKDPKNAKFIVEKLFAAKGKKDAMSIGLRQMGFWMGLKGMKQRDEAANVDISKLLAENHPNKAMRGLGYWMQKSGRVLTSIDYATSIPAKYTKFADLMLADVKARNSKLPKSEQMSQKQMEAIVNEILGETTDAVEAAMEQAEKDIATMYPKEKIDTKAKIPNKATVAYKARVFEILEQGREKRAGEVKEKVDWMADFTEEELDVYEKYADKYADKVSLMGTPNGTLGLVALAMKSIGTQFPGLRFIQAAPWFINAPLNLANLLYDSVPIVGLTRAGSFMLKGRRGALASDEAAQKLGFFTREQNERIYLEQRNALLKRVVALQVASWSMLALSGFFDDDEEKEKFKSKEDYIKSKPFYMTGSLSVNPEKAAAIEKAYNVKPYTFYVDGKDVLSFKNNALIAVLGLAGNTLDSRNFGNREDEEMLASYVNGVGSTIAYINETSATRGIADAIAAYMGIGKYEGATGSQYDRVVRSLAKNSASSIQAMFLPRVVPSMYKDIQGALQYDKKKATSFSEFLVNDVPFLEDMIVTKQIDHFGRPIKEEFFMPSPFGGLSLVGWENGVFTGPLKEIESQDKYYKMAVDAGYKPSAYKETKYFAEVSPLDYMGKETDKMKGFRGTVKEQGEDKDLKQNEKGMYIFQLDISPEKLAEINVVRGTYVREWLDKNEQIFMTKSKADRKKILENLFSTGTSLAKGKVLNLENEVYRFVPVPAGTSGFEVAGVNIPTKLND